MRNFHAWQRRTMRRADRQLWGGVVLVVATTAAYFCLTSFLEPEAPLAASVAMILRYVALLPVIAGATLAVIGAWTNWRLQRDPILLYYRRDGR
ncbi:hypothetical protein AB4059_05150 [Lysobacter sp. 2RAF19]